ncbi:MAG: TldD/PmbA family protein [Candidatus Cloacimonetes bacterium]|nr:TldD/PmbA family protein [Candidatus Cloacimonadota bacterium]
MFEQLKRILAKVQADYADLRYEIKRDTFINFSGKELDRIGANKTDGYVLRVLKGGGMSSVSFTRPEEAGAAIRSALDNAGLFSRNQEKPVILAHSPVIRENFSPLQKLDPAHITIDEKLELTRRYNNIPLSQEKIITTNIGYADISREKYFLNTEGSEINENLVTVRMGGYITSKEGNLTQNLRISSGGSNGFQNVQNLEEMFEKRTKIVLDLLQAKPIPGGAANCVLNPSMAGVFAHEAFGHFSEADIVESLPAMREKMQLGNILGNEVLSITDDATLPGQLGFYKYDDEGVAVRPVKLLTNGVLTGRLHSRRTAAEFNEPLSGHCVAEDFRYAPIIRMGTIFIEPGTLTLEELLNIAENGYYILDAKGGQTSGENFTFGAQYGYEVINGRLGQMVRDINISGNLYQTLKDITQVGNDRVLSRTGGCGKGQTNIRSCHGAPHVLVRDVIIGGV